MTKKHSLYKALLLSASLFILPFSAHSEVFGDDIPAELLPAESQFIIAPAPSEGIDEKDPENFAGHDSIADPAFDLPALPPLPLALHAGQFIDLPRGASNVFVANPEIADVQLVNSHRLHLFAKTHGSTTFSVLDDNNNVIYQREVFVEFNTGQLNEAISTLYPESNVKFLSLNGNLIVSGTVKDARTAHHMVALGGRVTGSPETIENHLKISGTNQVNLRVQIAEVNRDIRKELGFDLSLTSTLGNLTVGLLSGASAVGGVLSGTSRVPLTAALGNTTLSAVLDAFDDKGLVSLLAEPNLTAISGEAANFLVGGEFPVPSPTEDGGLGIIFRPFGIQLNFVPVVLEDNSMRIRIFTESSQITNQGSLQLAGFQVPSISVRRAETTVNLGSGQSFAIAGLLQNNINQSVEEFPGLGSIPILGALFRSTRFQKQETELIIVVTPYLVRPVSTQLALPTDGLNPSSDVERNLYGNMIKSRVNDQQSGLADASGAVGPIGPVGFILK